MLPTIRDTIILPVVAELAKRGITYKGVLYAGLMVTKTGIKVLEFNARFGDPETQAIMPRLEGDIIPVFEACINGTLNTVKLSVSPNPAVTVVLSAKGYPGSYEKGLPINGLNDAAAFDNVTIFHSGTARRDNRIISVGGRVLAVSASGPDLSTAVADAYAAIAAISLEGSHYRRDIAARAINRIK
jgi:phosphoribosylamine--glycine ligase